MRNFWKDEEVEILKRMIAEGKKFEEIALVLKRSRDSCASKATLMEIRGPNKIRRNFDIGVSAGIKNLSKRTIARPKPNKPCDRPCLCCGKIFRSWNRAKNQRCSRCNQMQDPGPYAL